MENMSMRDQLTGTTLISDLMDDKDEVKNPVEKNIDKEQMEFSTPIEQVMEPQMPSMVPMQSETRSSSKYPFNLKKNQVEALVAGVAAVIGFSDVVQNKVADIFPQMLGDSGRLSGVGMGVMALLVAVIFYFLKQFAMK